MVERLNGRLSRVLRSHHFNGAEGLEKTLHPFVRLLPQRDWDMKRQYKRSKLRRWKVPDLFVKSVRNHPGPDISQFSEERHKRPVTKNASVISQDLKEWGSAWKLGLFGL